MPDSDELDLDLVRRRVVNVVGHELRTPITTIRGLADLLADASPEELTETLIPALVRNARRAERLLDDLLIAGDISTAKPIEPPEVLDLGPIVDSVAGEHGLVVEGAPPPPVFAHRNLVVDTLHHLVDNALQYGDGPPMIKYVPDNADRTVTMTVSTPVRAEVRDIEHSFQLFFRGEHAVTRSAGLGIGLPVARALARLDGGDVTIEQDDDRVHTHLTLPRPT